MSLKNRLGFTREPVYLIDGSAFVYRGFYAYPDLKRSDGFPTNAMFIVLRLLAKLLREEKPAYLGFVLDGKGPTFRHALMESYKAQRMRMPENLAVQIEPLLEGLGKMGIATIVSHGVEADDVLASLANRFKKDRPVVLVGADKDLQQCLDENVYLWDPSMRKEKLVTLESFRTHQDLVPGQWPDYQALVGDKADNIPGIPGVGPKTALGLLKRFPSLEALRDGFERLSAKEQTRLKPHMEDIFLYRELTRLKTDCCADHVCAQLKINQEDMSAFLDFLDAYEFHSLKREFARDDARDTNASGHKMTGTFVEPVHGEALPDCAGKQVGMILEGKGVRIGLEGREYLFDACSMSLVTALGTAQSIAVPSLKDVLYHHRLWYLVPLGTWFDIGLAEYLLDPEERNYGFERIRDGLSGELDTHPENPALTACRIGELLTKRLEAGDFIPLMRELELPLIPVLVKMEQNGIRLDLEAFAAFLAEVQEKLDQLTTAIYQEAGTTFNIRSSQQLAEVLFDRLGIVSRKKTPGGKPSTSVQALEALADAHPVINSILRYRTLEKLRSTYLEPLPKLVDRENRVHTHFNNLATATGRLSSSKPNLQNIPIRGEFGPRMRGCFIARPGYKLVAADYSQIELRILAHMSKDPHLLDAFARNEDIHARTAALLFDKEPEAIQADERRKAKTINFGLLYGMGPQKLGKDLGLTLKEAKEFIARYFSALAKVKTFYTDVEKRARAHGSVTTIAGRRRLLPDINSRNANLAQQARRMAINTVVQGSAADVIKKAMLAVDRDPLLHKTGSRILLQVHDELVLEVPAENAIEVGERLTVIMSGVYDLDVPLAVDWGIGDNWAQAH
ncbi:DNA polymerase I [Desulfoplanes formicivorans]|uniref:DNA polymerase I n=1 Tax=Desulfoplanes formicivorans TaxID=1592317 RepID=A0A194AIF8_9BACT|nr:DNA polymerase I [Desulfoplanes formicivorans]GAU08856.1 DNA polymerase I [Desulfoplanes formicivorans]